MTTTTTKTKTKEIKDYPIIELNVNDIQKDPTNPNIMTLEQSRGLEKSMMNFGRLKHIVVDQNNVLIDGEHRLEVEKAIGTQKVNVIQVSVKDEIERKMMRETLNKLHGTYNKEKESSELLQIFENQRLDELAELLAQPKQELENLIQRYNPDISFVKEEDEAKLPSIFDTETFVKKGEIWQLGRHYLICGDCTNKEDVNKLLSNENTVDLLLTDPPYGVSYTNKNTLLIGLDKETRITTPIINDDSKSIKDYRKFFSDFLRNIPFNPKSNICYIFMSGQELHNLRLAFDDIRIKWGDYLIWIKQHHVLGRKDYNAQHEFVVYGWKYKHTFYGDFNTSILEFDKPQVNDLHPTQKPLKLLQKLITDGSQPNMLVYDPFLGSGSTLIACEQTNRVCMGMEIDEHYCSVIIKRWELYTGLKAQKV